MRRTRGRIDETGGPVFLGGDVGAPRGRAIAAVVVGAADLLPVISTKSM
ncbi:hypothetical protein D556_1011 [Bordetella holmesii 41130]|nr:hypothetical protein D558_1001 [Bordetella holmesii 44057]EWM42669.1 hypothetical protein D556_1011 [Bordetella holmesii 41130]EWM46249.1 hypothetical protein D555_1022 [Bordetella holmesii 35009]